MLFVSAQILSQFIKKHCMYIVFVYNVCLRNGFRCSPNIPPSCVRITCCLGSSGGPQLDSSLLSKVYCNSRSLVNMAMEAVAGSFSLFLASAARMVLDDFWKSYLVDLMLYGFSVCVKNLFYARDIGIFAFAPVYCASADSICVRLVSFSFVAAIYWR